MTMILTRLIIAPRYLLRKADFIVVRPRLSIQDCRLLGMAFRGSGVPTGNPTIAGMLNGSPKLEINIKVELST